MLTIVQATDRPVPRPHPAIHHCLELIRSEYAEMPGLHLTKEQMRRLFGCDQDACESAVCLLERSKFLRRTARGAYVRADHGA